MDKFKLTTQKDKLTDSEIEQQMNFDKFISAHTPSAGVTSKMAGAKKGFLKGTKLYTLIAASVIAVVSTVIYSNKKTEAEKIVTTTPFIIPPVVASNIVTEAFVVNAEVDTTIICKNGSFVKIPANVFEDEKGNDVKGKVEIKYREFHDQIDILLSGIPMNYDSAGNHYQLESAGMFEILAFKNNETIHLKANKQLNVSMVSKTNNTNDYNIYYLDTVKQQWLYKSENTAKNNSCFPLFYENKKAKNDLNTSTAIASSNPINKPVLPKKANAKAFNFSIDYQKSEFPELAAFNGLKFEPIGGEKKQHTELAKKTWEDVLIEKSTTNNEQYTITFSTENEKHSFNVIPVVDEKNYAASMKDFEQKQKQYEMWLAAKKQYENNRRDSLYIINAAYKGMAMRSNLNERFNNFIDDSFTETSKDLLAYRTFSVAKLGIWNSDMPCNFFAANPNYTTLTSLHKASFESSTGEYIILKNVYLIRRNVNSICSISKSSFNKFPYNTGAIDIMVGITYENDILYLKDQQLNDIKINDGSVVFKMNPVGDGVVSSEQLKNILKL